MVAAPEFAPHSTAADALVIEVHDTATGKPAAGASVWVFDQSTMSREELAAAAQAQPTKGGIARVHGVLYRAGPDGVVKAPPRTGTTAVAAQAGRMRGAVRVFGEPEPGVPESLRIDLLAARSIGVLVLDAAGAPAPNCRVGLASRYPDGSWQYARSGLTGADGRHHFSHVEEILADRGGMRLFALVMAPLAEGLSRELLTTSWPSGELEFHLPPTGAAHVQVAEHDGTPVAGDFSLSVAWRVPAEQRDENFAWSQFHLDQGDWRDTDASGLAIFPYVGVGMEVELGGTLDESRFRTTAFAHGPDRGGETVELQLRRGPPRPVAVVRLVGPDGLPLAGREVLVTPRFTDGRGLGSEMREADEDGRVAFTFEHLDLPPPGQRFLGVQEGHGNTAVSRFHEIEVPTSLRPGENDLGDLVLGGRPVVAGIVVDQDGAPVAETSLALRVDGRGSAGFNQFVRTGADGRFLFDRELESTGDLSLSVGPPPPYQRVIVPFRHGDEDLRIEVVRGSSLSGTVVLEEGMPTTWMTPECVAVDGSWRETGRLEHGAFRIDGVPPGVEFLFSVASFPEGEILFERRYTLAVGEQAAPPELNPLNLRGHLRYHRLLVLDENGEEIDGGCSVNFRKRDGDRGVTSMVNASWFEAQSTQDVLDLVVNAPGYQPERFRLSGTAEVRLTPGVFVDLDLDIPELPGELALVLECVRSMDSAPANRPRSARSFASTVAAAIGCASPAPAPITSPRAWRARATAASATRCRCRPPSSS